MRLLNIFLVGIFFWGTLSGLQCHYGSIFDNHHLQQNHPLQQQQQQQPQQLFTTRNNKQQQQKDEEKSASMLSIREYVNQAIHNKNNLAILYWNSTGDLDIPPLVEQCQFRNQTEPGIWPFYLSNLKLAAGSGSRKLALYSLSDATDSVSYNWSFPAPITLIAHTLPTEIANNLAEYPWIRFFPTPYELRGDGKRWVDRVLRHNDLPFEKRKSQIIYRGHAKSQKNNQRIRLMEMGSRRENWNWLNASSGINQLSQKNQIVYKYQLDIGGISGTTWTALRWKLCSKSLVFKVDSEYADWWHYLLKPMVHYIPVKADLSDLYSQYLWAESHPQQVQQIIDKAMEVCLQTTATNYLRQYTLQQIKSIPSPPTASQMGEYYEILENSRKRLQQGKPPLLFNQHDRFFTTKKQKQYQCPPIQLSPENV